MRPEPTRPGPVSVVSIIIRKNLSPWRFAAKLAGLAIGFMALLLSASFSVQAADDETKPPPDVPDKSGYSLFDPTPDDEMRKFTPDRPTKGYSVRTIDAGHFEQIGRAHV